MNMDKAKKDIGKRLQKCRKNLDLTQAALSERVGLQTKSYANVESGSTLVSIEVLMKLARQLNVSTDYILFGYASSASPLNTLLQNMEPADLERVERIIAIYCEGIGAGGR